MKNLLILGGTALAVYLLLNRQAVAGGNVSAGNGRVVTTTTGKVVELYQDKDGYIFDQYGGRWV